MNTKALLEDAMLLAGSLEDSCDKTSTILEVKAIETHGVRAVIPPQELSVGEVSRRSGVPVSSLHFYEAKGLIASGRNRGNQRRFPREVLRRIAVIKVAQRVGIPLSAIRDALASLPEGRTPTSGDWKKLSHAWRANLEDRIATLMRLRDQLTNCIGCGCLSLSVCPLHNPQDELGKQGPGPRLLDPIDTSVKGRARSTASRSTR